MDKAAIPLANRLILAPSAPPTAPVCSPGKFRMSPTCEIMHIEVQCWNVAIFGRNRCCNTFDRPLTEEQLRTVRSNGVYDIVTRVVLSGDGLCTVILKDSLGMFPDDPIVSGRFCYYGGQRYADRGECSAVGGDKRLCPCSIGGKRVY